MDNKENIAKSNSGKIVTGLIILIAGIVLLFNQLGYHFPDWLFTWPMILIAIGLISGVKHQFKNAGWIFMMLLGGIFLLDKIEPSLQIIEFGWPVLIIILGLWMIFGRNQHPACKLQRKENRKKRWEQKFNGPESTEQESDGTLPKSDDYLDTVSIFGGVTKRVFSKDFKGGEIVNIFGGSEIDFTQADINGRIILNVTQVFGGTKIIVPSHWQVVSDLAAVFGGIDDKRNVNTHVTNMDKVLVLKGTSIFAGIEIRSY